MARTHPAREKRASAMTLQADCSGRRRRLRRSELHGVLAALVGSVIGGSAAAATRYAIGELDPLPLAAARYTIGALCLAPLVPRAMSKIKSSREALAIVGLGILFFALYPFLFALSLAHTTAARGSLALSTMPLMTLGRAVLLGRETFSWRRLGGMLLAVAGLGYALSAKLDGTTLAPWKGDLIMLTAAMIQAVYNVLSRPFIQRVGGLSFTALAMGIGALALVIFAAVSNVFSVLSVLPGTVWTTLIYLGVFGCALLWVLWSFGIRLSSPSLVSLTVTVNALTASFLGAVFLSEPVGHELITGLTAVSVGVALATLASSPSRT
jgi:drug/metabolite transporter (DMT)-like permease